MGDYRLRYHGSSWSASLVDRLLALPVAFGPPAVLFALVPPTGGSYGTAVLHVGLALAPISLGVHRWLQGRRHDRRRGPVRGRRG
ncbi:hypothetical protein GCM10028777_24870 [Angustibacter speluncae]